jgi:hypothetical protein
LLVLLNLSPLPEGEEAEKAAAVVHKTVRSFERNIIALD